MSVYLYEESLVETLQKITGDDRVHVVKPEQAIQFYAQFGNDNFKLPAVVLSRNSVSIMDTRSHPATIDGQTVRVADDNEIIKMQLVPLRVQWQLDIFAVDRFTCDEIVRELVFYFLKHPRFVVKVPYNLDIEQNFDVFISPDIPDNSDLIEFPNKGEYYRETLTLFTENAYFYSSSKQYPTMVTLTDVDIVK